MRRAAGLTIGFVTAIFACGVVWATWYENSAMPRRSGEVEVAGLRDGVEITRDTFGIPTIRAQNEHDLVFAQGYVHAQDRLWQMELMRHVGGGTLSELLGDKLLESDRFLRTFGLPRAAAAQEAALDEASRALLKAYADGVNAFLAEGNALPPEYQVLRAKPRPWTIRNTLAIEKIMALDLAQYGLSVNRTRAVARLGPDAAAALLPPYASWGPTIIESVPPPAVPPVAAAMIEAGSIARASNSWVIGGARSVSGKPILANDMHLALRVPSIWYLVALHVDSASVTGMSIPGAPYVVAGHNRAIAWGLTNAMVDDADLYAERIDPADSTRYLTPGGSEPFTYVTDSIRVKGRDVPEVLRYRMTRHGPVISDVVTGLTDTVARDVIAVRWIGQDVSHTMQALPKLMRARGWNDFRAAVALFDDPHQNVVYADTAGHIGYIMAGRIPDRGGRLPPSLPVPGWTGEWDWKGYLPFDRHPTVFDPASGYVVTANNRQAAGALADVVSDGWETPFRAARIREMIVSSGQKLDADAVHRMQMDVKDASALRYRDRAVAAANAIGSTAVAQQLARWDGIASRESTAATVYYLFVDRLTRGLATSLYGDSTGWINREIVDNVLEQRAVPWKRNGSAVAFDTVAATAMRRAIALADGRPWGTVHRVHAEHALGSVTALERVLNLNVGGVQAAGSMTTVNVSHWSTLADGDVFKASVGASQRHVVDMADVDGAGGFILPGGQSGLPFADNYRDQWSMWLDGGLVPIPLGNAAVPPSAQTLRLRPAK